MLPIWQWFWAASASVKVRAMTECAAVSFISCGDAHDALALGDDPVRQQV
jgi:hypothetical protein